MLIRFYVSASPEGEFKERVAALANALKTGARVHGDDLELVHNATFNGAADGVDVAACWGLMGNSREIVDAYTGAGKRVLQFDKALIRRLGARVDRDYLRVGIDGPSPCKYMMREMRSWDRWERHRILIDPRQSREGRPTIVFAGSSQKNADFFGLGDANNYAEGILKECREAWSKSDLVYRPKPSWPGFRDLHPLAELSGSNEHLSSLLARTHVLITHNSSAAIEAIVLGVPAVTLGPCAAQFVSNKRIEDIDDLYFPSDDARFHWASNLAYCQWTGEEMASGEAWGFLKRELEATA